MAFRGSETNVRRRQHTGTALTDPVDAKIILALSDGIMVLRLDPTEPAVVAVIQANPAALRLLGVAGLPFGQADLAPPLAVLFDREHAGRYADAARTGKAAPVETVVAPSGPMSPQYAMRILPLADDLVALQFQDITEQERGERAVLALRNLSQQMHSTLDPERLLEILLRESMALMDAESGIAAFCTEEGISCFRFVHHGKVVPERECYLGGRFVCRTILSDNPYLANDLPRDPRANPEMLRRFQLHSALGTPIVDADAGIIGFLEVHNKAERDFTHLDEEQLAAVAQTAVTAMKNSLDYQEISRITQRLRETSQRYQFLVEDLDAIVWEADLGTWQFSFVSRQAEKVLGYPLKQWLTEPHFLVDHMHPEDRDAAVSFCTTAIQKGVDHQLLFRVTAADGRIVWLQENVRVARDPDGSPCCLRGLFLDVTDRIAVEDLLRRSESRFRSTFESAGIGIALISPKGYPIQTNPALRLLLGYGEEELTGRSFFELDHPDDREADLALFREVMEGRRERYLLEKRFLNKNGHLLWARFIVSLVRDGEEAPEYAIGMLEDITERKAAEEEVAVLLAKVRENAAQLELRVAERTSQLEEMNLELKSFAYSVSHDLRAPLRAIQGFSEILQDEAGLSATAREAVDRILSAARRMDVLIQDLLAYSRITQQEVTLNPVDLNRVVAEAVNQLRLETGERDIVIEVAESLPAVQGHHPVLTQVVLNLLTNAVKFVGPGVTPRIRIWAETEGDLVRLKVQDNGIGVAPEHRERIFNLFERLYGNEMYPGTGIGLAIVRKGVTRMGGRIGVESEPGRGSLFWIELPRPASIPE
ncbi:PAS domain S-box protein [Geomesophilobacter sediminis]|uniref:histidine kinase n=1 Tax=Geomesophilobacter sediminis TaxID=2798584 RepID=A0A8J7LUL8_9BACT|nr:PAS domain S-box protein [Geomesophilobacter sediminis]MBJ6723880.1 PAS domain S-box protein [Geomesophilobacter sediminis]